MAAQTQSKNELPADRPYKRHLDEAASHQTEDFREPGIVEKAVETISEYIPAAAGPLHNLTGQAQPTKTEEQAPPPPEPSQGPERPHHDEHIEEFVREQHRQDSSRILDKK